MHLATGSGKTTVFSEIIKRTALKNKKSIVLVKGRKLVDQASKRLSQENTGHSVLMANYPKGQNPSDLVLVASADTIIARKVDISNYNLLIVDEAHLAVNGKFKQVVESFPNYIIAVTATPYGDEPLTHLAEEVVKPITTIELIEQKYLVNAKYFAPNVPDLKGVKSRGGDYSEEELEKRMAPLTGDIIKHWKSLGENRPTLCFAVNIAHSKKIVDAFNSQSISALHLDADSSLKERDAAIEKLIQGQIKIISNVGIMNTGVDIPPLSCLILARPTKSIILHVQQLGRGTRPYPPQKKNFLVLDHAGNTIKHGLITQELEVFLEGKPKKEKISDIAITICKNCYLIFQGKVCPACSCDNTPRAASYEVANEGDLVELTQDIKKDKEIASFVSMIKTKQIAEKKKKAWLYYTLKGVYGEIIAARAFPRLHRQAQFISENRPSLSWKKRKPSL